MRLPANSLTEILRARAQEQGDSLAFRFLADGTRDQAVDWTYRDLAGRAAAVAAELTGAAGRRVVLAADPGLHYVAGLFGCLAAGAVAVPSFPPAGRRATARFLAIIADCEPDVIIVSARLAADAAELTASLPTTARRARWLFLDDAFFARPAATALPDSDPAEGPALLQYTSGSTGDPKGIVLSQRNLVSNCDVLEHHMSVVPGRVGCSWLPPYHDMGLMGTIMLAVHGGWPLVMLSPVHFVQQPYRWLKALTDYRVTISVAPNFAFDLCTDTVTDDELATLDLSSLRQLYCGAEPVLTSTLRRFSERFGAAGYSPSALIPCYGMAEATLFVSGKPDGTLPRSTWLDKAALERGAVTRARSGAGTATEVMSCGAVAYGHEVAVVDPRTCRPAGPGTVGEIWVSGPNVAHGYVGHPELTAAVFRARLDTGGAAGDRDYLRTGDAGFLMDGELYVTGRLKDIIIIAGRNLYPQDIEVSVLAASPDLRRAAAFSVRPGGGEEQLVVVAELRRAGLRGNGQGGNGQGGEEYLAGLRDRVIAEVTSVHAVRPALVHLGPPGTIATTTSGKVRRSATRQAYTDGTLKSLAPARSGALAAAGEGAR